MKDKNSKKPKPKKWTKFRHRVIFTVVRWILVPIFKLRYNLVRGKEEKKLPKSCIIMCNHQAVMDPFFMAATLKRPIYFVMSQDVFTLGLLSKLICYLVAPIPKSKSKSDLNTIRYTLKVLGEGGTVGLFPSGNRTLSGEEWTIDRSAAKLVKLAKVPLALYNMKGGYGADPRWGNKLRKGKVSVGLERLLTKEEIENMSVDELYDVIVKTLGVKDAPSTVKFKSSKKAEYLERALYYCPNCHSFCSLSSDKNILKCNNCGISVEYCEDLTLKPLNGNILGNTVAEWFNAQPKALEEYAKSTEGKLFADDVELRLIKGVNRKKLGNANIVGFRNGVDIQAENGEKYDLKFCDLAGCTVLGKRKINFYTADETTVQVKGSKRFNAIKYLNLYWLSKKGENNE